MLEGNKVNEQIEESIKKEQQKEAKKLTTIKPHKGHTLFEVEISTGDIREAEFEKTDIAYEDVQKGKNLSRKKVIAKDGCIYVSALNRKNVIKKLNRSKTDLK